MALRDEPVRIKNEEEAWEILQLLVGGKVKIQELGDLQLKNWPKITIRVQEGESVITPSMMEGFIELQKAILRSHAQVTYGDDDLRRVSESDKEALEFRVRVSKGSSNYEIDLQKLLETLGHGLIDKMDPLHIVIILVAMGVLFAGGSYLKTILQHKLERRRLEIQSQEKLDQLKNLQFMTQQETERQKILVDVVKKVPEVRVIRDQAETGRTALLESLSTVPSAKFDGVGIDGATADELTKSSRRKSEEERITGIFRVLRVDTTSPEGFRVRLQNTKTEEEMTAIVPDALMYEKQCKDIEAAEWSKGRVKVVIEATRRGEEIIDAKIVETTPVKKD